MQKLFAPAFFAATLEAVKVSSQIGNTGTVIGTDIAGTVTGTDIGTDIAGTVTGTDIGTECKIDWQEEPEDCNEHVFAVGLTPEFCWATKGRDSCTHEEVCTVELNVNGNEFKGDCEEALVWGVSQGAVIPDDDEACESIWQEEPTDCNEHVLAAGLTPEFCWAWTLSNSCTGEEVGCHVGVRVNGNEFEGDCEEALAWAVSQGAVIPDDDEHPETDEDECFHLSRGTCQYALTEQFGVNMV
jgi:hypothetical protein